MRRNGLRVHMIWLAGLTLLGCGEPAPEPEAATAEDEAAASRGSWRQWGGPTGDFRLPTTGLAASWPEEGPRVIWSRPLGEGYSAVSADGGTLFTMYRDGDDDVIIALRAFDGATRWERRYHAPTRPQNTVEFGKGPNATPLVVDNRVVTLGYSGQLNGLDRETGSMIWSVDLIEDLDGEVLTFGHSASPIAHDGKVLVLVGGERHGLVAFEASDGSVAWSGPPTSVSYATPIVIDIDGETQVVYFSADEIIGLDTSGRKRWSFPVVNRYLNNSTGPIWGDDNLLWVATQLDGGTRALRLTRGDEATQVEEVWVSQNLSIHFWNALCVGEHVYASVGSNASIVAGVDVRTGDILWRERGFEQVNFVHAGEKTILLDANGNLALVHLGPEGLEVVSRARILDGPTWTAPTLVGTTLYIRDKKTIRALDLS